MTTPAEHIMELLRQANIGTVGSGSGVRLGCGDMTDTPDTQVVTYDSPGEPPNPKWLLDFPYVQVMSRGAVSGYQGASTLIRQAYDALLGIDPQQMANGDRIDGIVVVSSPAFIGRDELLRPMFSANFKLFFEPSASTLTNRQPL